jgi:hypothetical protein
MKHECRIMKQGRYAMLHISMKHSSSMKIHISMKHIHMLSYEYEAYMLSNEYEARQLCEAIIIKQGRLVKL